MDFEWHDQKARRNLTKHRVTFDVATTVFGDAFAIASPDLPHSGDEQRWLIVGLASNARLLTVCYVERSEAIRIINAREATRSERLTYDRGRRR